MCDLYILILQAILTNKNIASGPDGHYIAVNVIVSCEEYYPKMAQALHKFGALKTPEITEFTAEDYAKVSILTSSV